MNTSQIPSWRKLPEHVRADLASGSCEHWYKEANREQRGALLTAYLKMKNHGLWGYVGGPVPPKETSLGNFEFYTRDVGKFQRALQGRSAFSQGTGFLQRVISKGREWLTDSKLNWEWREQAQDAAVHFKNFDGWPSNRVQFHVDRKGWPDSGPGWTGLDHRKDEQARGWEQVNDIRGMLHKQGYSSWFDLGLGGPTKQPIRKTQTPNPSVKNYSIKAGDRIWNLADKFGYKDRRRFTRDVLRLNKGTDPRRLRPGQVLTMPLATRTGAGALQPRTAVRPNRGVTAVPTPYVRGNVRSGETVSQLANRLVHGSPKRFADNFQRLNKGTSPTQIKPGSQFRLPIGGGQTPGSGSSSTLSRPMVGSSYKMERGDRVWNLAGRFGYRDPRKFVRDFKKLNPNVNPNRVRAGWEYKVPFRGSSGRLYGNGTAARPSLRDYAGGQLGTDRYRMQSGDRVWNLADRFGYSNRKQFVKDFGRLNPGVDPNRVFAGQTYRVPFRGK